MRNRLISCVRRFFNFWSQKHGKENQRVLQDQITPSSIEPRTNRRITRRDRRSNPRTVFAWRSTLENWLVTFLPLGRAKSAAGKSCFLFAIEPFFPDRSRRVYPAPFLDQRPVAENAGRHKHLIKPVQVFCGDRDATGKCGS